MYKQNWNVEQMPEQSGKTVIITGSNSGIGKEAAKVFAEKGAKVIMAVRSVSKGQQASEEIKKLVPSANIEVLQLDLSDLKSVESFANTICDNFSSIDILINNAGIMMCPKAQTVDGLEIQIGTNHFGHYALTARLYSLLRNTPNSRIVVLSSLGHKMAKINLDDVNWGQRKYNTNQAYYDSKLANVLFAFEYQRRFADDIRAPKLTIAHPGWTRTGLQQHSGMLSFLNKFFAQDVPDGALPTLRAATDPIASTGDFYGPDKFFEMHGAPVKVKASKAAKHEGNAAKLWQVSKDFTHVCFTNK